MNVKSILNHGGNYWMVNWQIVHYFNSKSTKKKGSEGIEEAIILAYLCSLQDYWAERDCLSDDGYFYCTADKMREDTTIEPRKQLKAIKNLEELGVIDFMTRRRTDNSNYETRRYFRINEQKLMEFLNLKCENGIFYDAT